MIREAVILAGGLGTRLRSVVADVPKCMAPVNKIPFIHFIVAHLKTQGIERFIFSLGYKSEQIIDYLDASFASVDKSYVVEAEQLGTGGAIKMAMESVDGKNVIILNGDTLFNIDLAQLSRFHAVTNANCTLALKFMTNFSRYGAVELAPAGRIKAFHEKSFCERGYINGGIYALNHDLFSGMDLPKVFSFERWLEAHTIDKALYGDAQDRYFIDIGIPEDYQRFTDEFNSTHTLDEEAGNNGSFVENFLKQLSE